MELHLTNLVPDQIIKALCTTLIHSLWQGLILAVVTGITIVLTKKASAALRYNLMIGYLLLFSIGIAFTFYMQLPAAVQSQGITAHRGVVSPTLSYQITNSRPQAAIKPANIISKGIGYFNRHADTIVLIWFLIICARCVQFAAGLQGIYYLKRAKTATAGAYWENRLAQLANNMAIKQTVNMLQSGIAKLPIVIGHIKPVILIPAGLLTALSPDEVESILLHELAHIKRRDYLVNLLQNLAEIIFFFNPAVLWVSALIKTERENCCDDMVVQHTSSKVSYINALVLCEEYRAAAPAYAMGLGGQDGHFLKRVKRMLSNSNQTLNRIEKTVLTVCLISAVIICAAFSKSASAHHINKVNKHFPAKNKTLKAENLKKKPVDTIKDKTWKVYKKNEIQEGSAIQSTNSINHKLYHSFVFKKDGVLYQYLGPGQDMNASGIYYVNGSAVPKDKLARYLPIFEQAKIENDDSGKSLQQTLQNGQKQGNADTIVKLLQKGRAAEQSTPDELANLRARLLQLQIQHNSDSVRLRQAVRPGNDYATPATPASPATPGRPAQPYTPQNYAVNYPVSGIYTPEGRAERVRKDSTANANITADLLKDGLITDEHHFNFKLGNSGFYVNGKKQDTATFERYKKKYIAEGQDSGDWSWSHSINQTGESVTHSANNN